MAVAKIIAIDGPAGSGKSTLGRRLARSLEYLYFDTGVMYRAVTWASISRSVHILDEKLVTELSRDVQIDVRPASVQDGRLNDVLVDGEDVTWMIRKPKVDMNVSIVAAYPGVRKALTGQQRRVGLRGKVVMVGRDIGTVVLPEADLKIYLDASVEERARRRHKECLERGETITFEEVMASMQERDHIDTTREVAPLKAAHDAVILQTNGLDADQVLEKVKEIMDIHPREAVA